ncbi:MAG: glutaredoxin family protein [Gammaproteobacteria bacterium]
MSVALTLYGRSGCHLCEDMEQQLRRLQPEHGFELAVVDIDGDPALGGEYGLKIPVLMAGAREICHYRLDFDALARILGDE